MKYTDIHMNKLLLSIGDSMINICNIILKEVENIEDYFSLGGYWYYIFYYYLQYNPNSIFDSKITKMLLI